MKEKPTSYLYNFYDKDDGDGEPIIVNFNGYKVQLGINVVIMPGFRIIPSPNHAGSITVIGSNSFIGVNATIKEGDTLVPGTIIKGDQLPLLSSAKIVLAADDFGRREEANECIQKHFYDWRMHHASLMVNFGSLTNEAVTISEEYKFSDQLGLHFSITDGFPCSSDISEDRFTTNGKSSLGCIANSRRSAFFLLNKEKKLILSELKAQIAKFKELGLQPKFFDSHGNIHFKWPIAKLITPVLVRAGFTNVRIPRTAPSKHKLYDYFFKHRVTNLYKKHFITYDAFINAKDIFALRCKKFDGQTIEIMVHPFIKNRQCINRRDVDLPVLLTYLEAVGASIVTPNK